MNLFGIALCLLHKKLTISRCISRLMLGVIFIEPTNTKNKPINTESVVNTIDLAILPALPLVCKSEIERKSYERDL